MKTRALFLCVLLAAVSSSSAIAGESKECRFKDRDKEEIRCKVRVSDDDDQVASRMDESPVAEGKRRCCEKVRMEVKCSCGFELRDDFATLIKKRDESITVGTERGKLAALVTEDDWKKAVLTISGPDCRDNKDDGFARRLVGECRRD